MRAPDAGKAVAPPPSEHGRLLGALLSSGTLVQPEPVLTRAVRFLLGLPGGHDALDILIREAGVEPPSSGFWLTEVNHVSGGRTDLEYWGRGASTATVVIEAKIGHHLEVSQLAGYRARLPAEGGLLVVLVPASRLHLARSVVEELRAELAAEKDAAVVTAWTWEAVADAIEQRLPHSADVVQLRGLIAAAGALDVLPFAPAELLTFDDSRLNDLWRVLDRASTVSQDRRTPAQSRGPFRKWRRVPVGKYDASIILGLGRTEADGGEPWAWVAVEDDRRFGHGPRDALLAAFPDAVRGHRYVGVPLDLTPGTSGFELTAQVQAQLERVGGLVRDALEAAEAIALRSSKGRPITAPLSLGSIPPFAPGDLLETSTRRSEVAEVMHAVAIHLRQGSGTKWSEHGPFADRTWIGLDPHKTHLSLGIERTDPSDEPRPLAWISVWEGTPASAVVMRAMKSLFPGVAVSTPDGLGVPVEILPGSNGPEAFHAVVAQFQSLERAVRQELSEPVAPTD